jgi:hypothetical protein
MTTAVIERYYEAYEKFGFEKTLSNNRELVSQEDENLIRRFIDDRIAIKGIGIPSQTKYGVLLVYWKRYIKAPYSQLTTDDIVNGIGAFRNYKKDDGETYKQNYQREMIVKLKTFITWLNDENMISVNLKKLALLNLRV